MVYFCGMVIIRRTYVQNHRFTMMSCWGLSRLDIRADCSAAENPALRPLTASTDERSAVLKFFVIHSRARYCGSNIRPLRYVKWVNNVLLRSSVASKSLSNREWRHMDSGKSLHHPCSRWRAPAKMCGWKFLVLCKVLRTSALIVVILAISNCIASRQCISVVNWKSRSWINDQ